jgi:hypothetical protein
MIMTKTMLQNHRFISVRKFTSSLLLVFFIFFFQLICIPAWSIGPIDLMDRYTGTRAMAMGSAYTALADDLSAPYWNPAGLTKTPYRQAGTTYMSFFGMADRFSIDGIYPLKKETAVLAYNFVQESMQGIPKTTEVAGSGIQIGEFAEYKKAFNVSYAKEFNSDLSWGVNARLISNSLDTESAFGQGFDAGLLWTVDSTMSLGFMARNFISRLSWSTSELEYYAKKYTVGISIKDHLFQEIPTIFAFDYEFGPHNENNWYAGTELWLVEDLFAFRMGTNSLERWTFGTGIIYYGFALDFCYWQQEYLGEQYLLSIGYNFDSVAVKKNILKTPRSKARSYFITPQTAIIEKGEPLIINIEDPDNQLTKAACAFSKKEIVPFAPTENGFILNYQLPAQTPLEQLITASIYLQDINGKVYIDKINYLIKTRKKAAPVVTLNKKLFKPKDIFTINMAVSENVKILNAVVEFSPGQAIPLGKITAHSYSKNIVLPEDIKPGEYRCRIIVKMEAQPLFEKIIPFTVI